MTDNRLRIAMCCSGGDAAGMNPWERAVTRLAMNRYGAEVIGVKGGYAGLVRTAQRIAAGELTVECLKQILAAYPGQLGVHRREQELVCLDRPAVCGLARRGGASLKAGRCRAFHEPAVRAKVGSLLRQLKVQALLVCGGNGSLAGAECLAGEADLQVIVTPATIDNDVAATEMALGVDTAVNSVVWAVERFCDTAASHGRIMVLEVMGRDSGSLARLAGVAAGAEIVVTPERGPLGADKMQRIAGRLERSLLKGREYGIVLVAEGVKLEAGTGSPAMAMSAYLQDYFRRPESPFPELETRANVLGHLARGGSPTAADRILAARFAETALQTVVDSPARSGVVGLRNGQVIFQEFGSCRTVAVELESKIYQLHKDLSQW